MSSRAASEPVSVLSFVERHEALIVLILGIILLLPGTWSESGVTTKDEYWLSFRTPLETLARGDWLTTWVNGEPRLRKPPLLYWAIMATYSLLGVSPFAARLWGVLAGAGLAACTCLIGRELFRKSGLLAGLIVLSTIGVAIEGRQAMLDLPLAAFTALAVYFAIRWWKTEQLGWIMASALSLGLSFLVKGPMGILFFALTAITGLFVFRQWHIIPKKLWHIGAAVVLLLAVCLPWPLLMIHLWPNFFQVLGEEAGQRQFGRMSLLSPLSALGGALGLIFPWTLALLAAIGRALLPAQPNSGRKSLWLTVWYIASALPLFFMQSFERYMLPVVPPMAILCASWMERSSEEGSGQSRAFPVVMKASAILVFACLALIWGFFLWFEIGLLPAVICLALGAFMLRSFFPAPKPLTAALTMGLLFSALFGWLYPCLGIEAMPKNIEQTVTDRPVGVYEGSEPAMLSVRLGRSVVPLSDDPLPGPHALCSFDGFVFVEGLDAHELEAAAAKAGMWYSKVDGFKTFYSRKTWLRFVRRDATLSDWMEALRSHSLEDLKTEMVIYRICRQGPCP